MHFSQNICYPRFFIFFCLKNLCSLAKVLCSPKKLCLHWNSFASHFIFITHFPFTPKCKSNMKNVTFFVTQERAEVLQAQAKVSPVNAKVLQAKVKVFFGECESFVRKCEFCKKMLWRQWFSWECKSYVRKHKNCASKCKILQANAMFFWGNANVLWENVTVLRANAVFLTGMWRFCKRMQ